MYVHICGYACMDVCIYVCVCMHHVYVCMYFLSHTITTSPPLRFAQHIELDRLTIAKRRIWLCSGPFSPFIYCKLQPWKLRQTIYPQHTLDFSSPIFMFYRHLPSPRSRCRGQICIHLILHPRWLHCV